MFSSECDKCIGIVDKLSFDEQEMLKNTPVLSFYDLGYTEVEEMVPDYNVIELNTAVKPYYIEYFFTKGYQKVVYLDPDIMVFDSLDVVFQCLDKHDYVLTPHMCTPISDDKQLKESICLSTGTFNLGFFAIRQSATSIDLLDWWKSKLKRECLLAMERGFFVDQKWMNLSICYFDNFLIQRDLGWNMAYWNMHERVLSKTVSGNWIVNNLFPLIFFHFSSFKPEKPEEIAPWQNRFSFDSRKDIAPVFQIYRDALYRNGYEYWSNKNLGIKLKPIKKPTTFKGRVKDLMIKIIDKF